MSKTERYIGYGLWGLVVFNAILAIVLAGWQITPSAVTAALLVALWWVISLGGAGLGLVIVYRRYLKHWSSWLGLIALFIVGALVINGTLRPANAHLSLLATLLFPISGAALLGAVLLLLYQYDVGARLVAVLSLAGIWGLVISWQSLGNIVEAMFQYLQTGKPAIIWWFTLFFLVSICLIPLGALSFAWHTIRLVWREGQAGRRVGQ